MCLQAIWYVILCYYDADTSLWCWISTSLRRRNDGCCMISPVCRARHQHGHRGQTGSAAQQHSTLWTLDMRRHIQGGGRTFKLSTKCHLQFVWCSRYPRCPYLHTTHTKPANKKLRSPAQRGDLATKIDYETQYLHVIVQLPIRWSINSIIVCRYTVDIQ